MNERRGVPTYDLARVQALVERGVYRITLSSMRGAAHLGFDESDVCACVLALSLTDFHKTMEANKRPGLWQDAYRTAYGGERLYVKVQIAHDTHAVVVSFKQR